ncbi:MAG: efflux RND transporter permease subunit [Betaproteobacteria bacterium]|nr:efflux RND transporter permease subunit [Gammaproteobacteria bacterium]MDH3437552.1 efflux RND transporter permease subunit [Betaproteobacteria bacterium]
MAGLGFSGSIAQRFKDNQLTPLLALTGLLLGLFAVLVTPREEEPQIDVTLANVLVRFPGASAIEVEQLVSTPMEQVLAEIEGVEHTYSVSYPGLAVHSVQFEVGEPRNEALVRLYNAVYSNQDWLPANLGAQPPLIKPKSIDDVPIVTVTLWTADPERGAHELLRVAHAVEAEIKRVPGTRNVYTVGGPDNVVNVRLDAQRLAGYNLSVDEVRNALAAANRAWHAGPLVAENQEIPVQAGTFLANRDEVAETVVGLHAGRPVFLEDVAAVIAGPDQPERYVWYGLGPAGRVDGTDLAGSAPAVTLAVSKKPGTNAVQIARRVVERLEELRGIYIPDGVEITVTRNYGETANEKSNKLIQKLLFATVSVVVLVLLTLGWREAVVVGAAVVVTLAITLFASWAWGFTLNRVSLFALIFAIGILVDDAIVVVENIHRHMARSDAPLSELVAPAVDEVGGPTILATFTVIAALLPMAFVTGLMGPYMSPIPINASTGMLISLVVALIFTPWLSVKLLRRGTHKVASDELVGRLGAGFERLMRPFLRNVRGRRARLTLFAALLALFLGSGALVVLKTVVLKMLPFDNKSEFQVVVDMPEGSSVEQTARVLDELAERVARVPEVRDYQAYAGTAAPIDFNGLVRQYYLRGAAYQGDLQVNLVDKHNRKRKSHEIARAVRPALAEIGHAYDASIKVVEVPPGPPVRAPLVAEIYGPDYDGQIAIAQALRRQFETTPDIVDVDDSVEAPAKRIILEVDRHRAALLGVSQASVADTLEAALGGADVTYIHTGHEKHPVPVRVELPVADKSSLDALLALELRSTGGALVPLSEVVIVREAPWDRAIHHKDLLRVTYVTGDMAGPLDSPLYGLLALSQEIASQPVAGQRLDQHYIEQPENPYRYSVKWDGEWQITYETFRDMGIAYGVGLILIYLLVVAQFRSYLVPLVIMAPIPLTLLGVMPGHALLGVQFTATSMIGMIALAGIIVRNSILLVDFIQKDLARGRSLDETVIRAAAARARPIILTGLAAMLGAFFILDDPIFSGLAVSLIFGILVSTGLTLIVIPVLYYSIRYRSADSR